MDMSYKGVWGYHPLVVSPSDTGEVLHLVNRPGNVVSHSGAAEWIDRAVGLVAPHAERVCVRGDTDFSLTAHVDRWSEGADFIFGYDSQPGMVKRAEALDESDWTLLERRGAPHAPDGEDAEEAGGREGADRAGASSTWPSSTTGR